MSNIEQYQAIIDLSFINYNNLLINMEGKPKQVLQSNTTIRMKRFDKPFVHYYVQNFLSNEVYQRLVDAYSHLQFKEKESDLFHFFQTNELVDEPSMQFFKQELNRQFGQLGSLKDSSYNIFASYYFKGNYLLCHDDVIEDRKYAFSYYLQDHASADLVLYDETASKIEKSIKVKKNTLVIFEVSNISYHEVAFAQEDGRKAVTGWLNYKGQGQKRAKKEVAAYKSTLPSDLTKFQLDIDLSEEFIRIPNMEYMFDISQRRPAGPYFERKATKLQLNEYVVLDFNEYRLFSADFLHFGKGDYLLLNDPVNMLGQGFIDVFILQLPNGQDKTDTTFISIVDQDGNVTESIPYQNNSMYIINRGKKNYYIDLVQCDVYVGHLIYKHKQSKKKAVKAVQIKQTKSLRAKMIANNLKNTKSEQFGKLNKNKKIKKEEKGQQQAVKRGKGKR